MRKAAIHLSHQNLRKAVLQMQARIMLSHIIMTEIITATTVITTIQAIMAHTQVI